MSQNPDLRLGRWEDDPKLVSLRADVLITDTPFSVRTHASYETMESVARSTIGFAAWGEEDVARFAFFWAPRTSGWFCALTDHVLAPAWERWLAASGRYVFSPLACVDPGSRVRVRGDGPSQWTTQLIVARPRDKAFAGWGAMPGAYVRPSSELRTRGMAGSKPLWLMRAIVRDYSMPGQLVVDPCAGTATTLIAAAIEGRASVGWEVDPRTHALGRKRIAGEYTAVGAERWKRMRGKNGER